MKFGMLGVGGQAALHAAAIHEIDDAELLVVAAAHSETADAFARTQKCASTDLATLLKDTALDAVIVATPTHLHVEQVIEALDAGKHVLCEAPVTWELSEIDQMLGIAEKAGRLLRPGLIHRFDAELQFVEAEIRRGAIGELVSISTRRLASPDWLQGQTLAESHYGDSIHELLYYDLDAFNWILGEIPEVVGASGRAVDGGFLQIAALMRAGDVTISAEASQQLPSGFPFTIEMDFVGTEAQIQLGYRFPADAPPEITLRRRDPGKLNDITVTSRDPFQEQIRIFMADALGDHQPFLSPRAARDALELALAIEEAAQSRP